MTRADAPNPIISTPDQSANGIQTLEDARKAAQAMAEAVERLSEVDEASVIALGDTALVGLKFGSEYKGQVDDRMKKMVLARVQTVDKSIQSVAVTSDVKWLQDIQAMGQALGSATGLDDVRGSGGSPITYSEMRRAAKISKEASLRQNDTIENTPIVFTPGAVE